MAKNIFAPNFIIRLSRDKNFIFFGGGQKNFCTPLDARRDLGLKLAG